VSGRLLAVNDAGPTGLALTPAGSPLVTILDDAAGVSLNPTTGAIVVTAPGGGLSSTLTLGLPVTTVPVTSQSADLSVTKTDSPDPVPAGGNFTYTITVANAGPSDSTNVVFSDSMPAGTTLISFGQVSGPAAGCSSRSSGFDCTIATLPSGQSAVFTLVARADASLPHGYVIQNSVFVEPDVPDPDHSNDLASETTTVAGADLSVTKTDSPDPVAAGGAVTYRITVRNTGLAAASNVELIDVLQPFGASFSTIAQVSDIVVSEIKAALFGLTVGIVAAYRGLNPPPGPKGVGMAVNQTVVISFVLVFLINLVVTTIYLQLVPARSG